jgi:uncharacterized protein YndB with AHSA1/START domain
MTDEYLIVKSVEISATPRDVWRVLTDPEMIARWMLGTRVETTWQPGAAITFDATLHGLTYQDRGTLLAIEPERSLAYSHWSDLSRLPDIPENRTLVRLTLEWTGEKTRLTVRHEQFYSYEAYGHSNFFWGYALGDIRCLAEGTPMVATGGMPDTMP